jgi:hypothetical protein|tara:strand:+ start:579 stop:833 length:255 start_codon:yes stop_codon:yes gene_type:complete
MTDKNMFKSTTYNSLEDQVGGKHYRKMKIQPAEFINENRLLFAEGNAIKYICRHSSKGKAQDIQKAIHYLEMILERDYDADTSI